MNLGKSVSNIAIYSVDSIWNSVWDIRLLEVSSTKSFVTKSVDKQLMPSIWHLTGTLIRYS